MDFTLSFWEEVSFSFCLYLRHWPRPGVSRHKAGFPGEQDKQQEGVRRCDREAPCHPCRQWRWELTLSAPQRASRMNEGGSKDRTCTPGRKRWKRKGSLTLGSLFTGREISWTAKESQRLRGGQNSRLVAGRTERRTSRRSWPPRCTPQPKSRIYWCTQGLRCGNSGISRQMGLAAC